MRMKEFLFRSLQRVLAPLPVRWFKKLPGAAFIYTTIYRSLKPHGIRELQCVGHRMVVNTHDEGIARQLLIKGIYEEEETHFFLEWLEPGMAVLDIGANFGYFTLLASKAVARSGRVLAFEPEPANFALLEKNIQLNEYPQARAFALALSNREGTVRLFTDSANLGNPSLSAGNVPPSSAHVDVRSVRLDDVLASEKDVPGHFDLVKMDVQGAEALVIEGARELLKRDRPTILMEFWPKGLRNMGSDPRALLETLDSLGYTPRRVSRRGGTGAALSASDVLRMCDEREEGEDFMNLLFEPRPR
jgi:FkbM family methyltransferase